MATTTRTRRYQPSLADKVEALLSNAQTWKRLRDRSNRNRCIGYAVPSLTRSDLYHLTDGKRCTCEAGLVGRECCHRAAAEQYIAQRRDCSPRPAVLPTIPQPPAPTLAERVRQYEQELFGDLAA